MSEKIVKANGVDICTESFGDPSDPTILLVMGATASMLRWDVPFCERLAAGGRHVIRYDNLDTGRSTTYDPGIVPYTVEDMADAVVFLASDQAKFINGVGLPVDGGMGM